MSSILLIKFFNRWKLWKLVINLRRAYLAFGFIMKVIVRVLGKFIQTCFLELLLQKVSIVGYYLHSNCELLLLRSGLLEQVDENDQPVVSHQVV